MESIDINGLIHIVVLLGGILSICKMFIGRIEKRIDDLEAGQNRFEIELANIKNNQANFEKTIVDIQKGIIKNSIALIKIKENQAKLEKGQANFNRRWDESEKRTLKDHKNFSPLGPLGLIGIGRVIGKKPEKDTK